MTVILVLATFIGFLLIDHFMSRGKAPVFAQATETRRARGVMPMLQPNVVSGFEVRDNLRYHPGHTWALSESPNLVRIGIDDFASKVIGKAETVQLPQRGQWIRQGQKVWSFIRNGQKIDMVSPIEGSVADVNEALLKDAGLANDDPYGEGWVVTVQSPDAKTNFRNLMTGTLAKWWTEQASALLMKKLPTSMALAQDGGSPAKDLGATIPQEKWAEVTREFFLT